MKPNQIGMCSACGSTGKGKRRGSGGIEICLWLFLLWPIALIYTVWRSSGAACAKCGSTVLVPINSPVAAQLVVKSPQAGSQMQAFLTETQEKKRKEDATDAMIWKGVLWFCAILVVGGVSQIFIAENTFQILLPLCLVGFIGYKIIKKGRSVGTKEANESEFLTK